MTSFFLKKGEAFVAREDCEIMVIPASLLTTNAYKALCFAIQKELFELHGRRFSFREIHFFNIKNIAPPPKILYKGNDLAFIFESLKPLDIWDKDDCLFFYQKTIELWADYNINLF